MAKRLWFTILFVGALTIMAFPAGALAQTPDAVAVTPASQTQTVGNTATVTATVTEASSPLQGITVNFSVTGANTASGTGTTDANGQVTFSYIGTATGTDTVTATAQGGTNPSGTAIVDWTPGPPSNLTLNPASQTVTLGNLAAVTATVTDQYGNPVTDGTTVNFSASGANTASGSATTTGGDASFTYFGVMPGTDTVTATAVGGSNPSGTATVTWVVPASTPNAHVAVGNVGFGSMLALNASASAAGTPSGWFTDIAPGMMLKSTSITSVTLSGPSATVFGTGVLQDGTVVTFRADVLAGTPGLFHLQLSTGYDSGWMPVLMARVY